MSHKRLSAIDFDILVGDIMVHVESMSATIDDASTVAKNNGMPDGYVSGEVSCNGDIEIDSKNFNRLVEVARGRGSFRDLPTFDIICYGKNPTEKQRIELFGCLLKVSDLFGSDGKGGEKTKHKLTFDVCGEDFVRINGVPYLSETDTRGL